MQRKADRETWGWDRLPLTAQRIIIAESAADSLTIPAAPPSSIHCYLDMRKAVALQADFDLTYVGHNLYLPTSFYQDLLQGHILTIPLHDAPTQIPPLFNPPSLDGPENAL